MLAQRDKVDREFIYKSREDMIAGMPAGKRRALIAGLSQAVQSGEKDTEQDYILTLILNRNYDEAVKIFSGGGIQYYDYLLSWTAWAYFKTGNTGKAKQFYQQILKGRPDYIRANIGLAYCLAEERQYEKAVAILDKLLQKNRGIQISCLHRHRARNRKVLKCCAGV
jgi:tetratricopeptide (TPR) repeat protein